MDDSPALMEAAERDRHINSVSWDKHGYEGSHEDISPHEVDKKSNLNEERIPFYESFNFSQLIISILFIFIAFLLAKFTANQI